MLSVRGTDYVTITSLGEDYPALLAHVMQHGDTVSSRIGETREILDLRLVLNRPWLALVGRKGMSDDFALEEATQLLSGRYDGARLAALVPRAAELLSTPTAYGPRTVEQLEQVETELMGSPTSRRAVVYVGRHDDLAMLQSPIQAEARQGEMPCTCLWQFHVRNNTLDMSVYMRSWDLVWGLSYDIPSFTAIHRAMAKALGVAPGVYVHNAGSAHIYDRHWDLEVWEREDCEFDAIEDLLGATIAETRANCARAMED